MTRITVLPHKRLCPAGKTFDAAPGTRLAIALLDNDVPIENACENSCACATCHVFVREGFHSLRPASEKEEDMLDRAWGVGPSSRLSCQTLVGETDLTLEIPRYSVNLVREGD